MTAINPDLIAALINEKITDAEDTTSAQDLREVYQTIFDTLRERMLEVFGGMNPNTTTASNSTGRRGDWYEITASGTKDFGSGGITFNVGDIAWHNGTEFKKIPTSALVAAMVVGSPPTGAALSTGGDYLLANGGTYTISAPGDNAVVTLRLAPGTTATVTGIGTLSNVSSTRFRARSYQFKAIAPPNPGAPGSWSLVDDYSGRTTFTTFSLLTDAGYFEGEHMYASLGSSVKIQRDFGSGTQNIYDGDEIRSDGTKQVVIPSSRLRLPWIRLNDLGLVEGHSATLAEARSNSTKLRAAIATLRTIHNSSINITGNGIFVFADEISNCHWPNYAASKSNVSNATYSRTNGTITLASGGWTALALDGPNKVFRIEDDTNPANDGTYITAEAFNSTYYYSVGDCVYQGGNVYISPTAQSPLAFNASNWTLLGSANNVLAVRNVLSIPGLGLVKFPVNGTTSSLGIVPLHTTVGGASQGRRTDLAIESPSSGSLILKRFAGGTVIRRYAFGITNVFTQDLANGPGGVGATEMWWSNKVRLKGLTAITPNGHAIHLDGSGHSGAFDFIDTDAQALGVDFPCVYLDNCYSGNIHSLRILQCAGHGVFAQTFNTFTMNVRVEGTSRYTGSAAIERHGVWLNNCHGGSYHVNSEGCSGKGFYETGCTNLFKTGYVEGNNHGTNQGYPVGGDFVFQAELGAAYSGLGSMRMNNPGDEGIHAGCSWNGWLTPLTSRVTNNQNLFIDFEKLAKKLPEGGLSRKRRAIFKLEDFYNMWANSAKYISGTGSTLFGLNEASFDGSWGTEKPYESAQTGLHNNSYVSLEHQKLRFYFPANSHNAALPGFPNRSIRWMDGTLASGAQAHAVTWTNSGSASVQFSAKDYLTDRRQYRVTVAGVDWAKLGVREGMDLDITGFTSDSVGADSDPNKRFTVVAIKDNQLFLKIREIDGATEVTSLTETLSAITFAFDWPEQKFKVSNISVPPNDVLIIDVQYSVGAAYQWFRQFNKLKTKNDPQNDFVMWAAQIGFTHASNNYAWRLMPRGEGPHRERFFWRNTSGSTWSPGTTSSPSNQIILSVCKQPNATQWPSATASPAYDLEFDMLDFIVCDGAKLGTI